jgi:hypothetical protein
MADRSESREVRIAGYLDHAGEALAAAAAARYPENQQDYLAIAASWMKLAEFVSRSIGSLDSILKL